MEEGNIRLGKVAFVDKGTYSAATTYNTFDSYLIYKLGKDYQQIALV